MNIFEILKKIFIKKPKSKIPDQKYMKVSEYQFVNLIINRVPCLLLDLRIQEANKPTLRRATLASEETFLDIIKAASLDMSHPILIVCDDGVVSNKVADILADKKYYNVVVLENGIRSLSSQAKIQIQI